MLHNYLYGLELHKMREIELLKEAETRRLVRLATEGKNNSRANGKIKVNQRQNGVSFEDDGCPEYT